MEKHFAALRIPDTESDQRLTRAFSFSELPTARRILIEQCYQAPNTPGLIRQYSCEQIFDKHSNTSQVKISQVVRAPNNNYTDTWKTNSPYFHQIQPPHWVPPSSNDVTSTPSKDPVEYMDIDADSSKELETMTDQTDQNISPFEVKAEGKILSETVTENTMNRERNSGTKEKGKEKEKKDEDIKKKLRPLVSMPTREQENKKGSERWKLLFFFLISILSSMVAISFYQHDTIVGQQCDYTKKFSKIVFELHERIYGQDQAISSLSNYLIKDNPCLKMIALVGGKGVGKTYTVEVIRKYLPVKENFIEYFPPLKDGINFDKLSSPHSCTFIILENLGKEDIPDVVNFLKSAENFKEYCIIIFGIFNMEDVDDYFERKVDSIHSSSILESSFQKENINIKIIHYEPLTYETLEKCIVDAASKTNLILTDNEIEWIKRGLSIANSGCKGVYPKVQILGRKE